jgi:hypothetical protein
MVEVVRCAEVVAVVGVFVVTPFVVARGGAKKLRVDLWVASELDLA